MPTMRLYLLGAFQVILDGKPLTGFRSDKVRALLAYLALAGGKPVRRTVLAALLWDGYPPKAARASLRIALVNLRRMLNPVPIFTTTPQAVQLNSAPPHFWCDALALAAWLQTPPADRPLAPLGELNPLEGAEFMPEFATIDSAPFQAWLSQRRQHYRELIDQSQCASRQNLPSAPMAPTPAVPPVTALAAVDALWSSLPEVGAFYGYRRELAQLKQWAVYEQGQVIMIGGMGGQDKSALAAHFAQSLTDQFDRILWTSLVNAPPLHEVLPTWLQKLAGNEYKTLPVSLDEQLDLLVMALRQRRCLLVLDNFEGVMADAVPGGELPPEAAPEYRPGCEGYPRLLQQVGTLRHQSCLVLTSREEPRAVQQLAAAAEPVFVLRLTGLAVAEGQELLAAFGVRGTPEEL